MTKNASQLLTLDQAAERLGVHYMTVYRYVRLGQLPAQQQHGRWWVDSRDVAALQTGPTRRVPEKSDKRLGALRARLLGRMDAGDVAGAWSIVESALRAGTLPTGLYVNLLGPVLAQVGDEWASGTRSIASEHLATSVGLRLVGRLGPRGLRPGRRRTATIVLGGAPGDPHQLPLLMVVDVLRWEGFTVVDLGADVPVDSFLEAATAARDLVAVGVSLSVDRHRRGAARVLTSLRTAVPEARLLAGGPAVRDEASARGLGADGWASHAGDVAAAVGAGRA